jgi:hypothetical protein
MIPTDDREDEIIYYFVITVISSVCVLPCIGNATFFRRRF